VLSWSTGLEQEEKATFSPCSPGALGLEQKEESLMYEGLDKTFAHLK
jgi:hypothetical protein